MEDFARGNSAKKMAKPVLRYGKVVGKPIAEQSKPLDYQNLKASIDSAVEEILKVQNKIKLTNQPIHTIKTTPSIISKFSKNA